MSSGAIPARGAFSAHLQIPESASESQMSRRSTLPSVLSLSSPHSGYEYYPDNHSQASVTQTVRRGTSGQRPSPDPRSPPPPPPSRLRPPRAASVSVAQPIRKPSTVAAHHPDTDTNRRKSSVDTRGTPAFLGKEYQQQDKVRPSIKNEKVSDQLDTIGINRSTIDTSEDEYQATSALVPIPSVHPIDTLAKKLRQQALELTVVYEQLEKKAQALQDQEKQTQELKFQLESLKCAKQNSSRKPSTTMVPTRSSSATATTRQSVAPKSSTTAASMEVEELERHVQELERERKQHELSTKRIEKALADLKAYQSGRMHGHGVSSGNASEDAGRDDQSSSLSPELLIQEQQLYIRVLEEAVHLKASELHVTGHEELLMVLAELRHTIYQQEQDVADKQSQVERLATQLHEQNEKQLMQTHQLDEKSTKRELEIYELRQEKSKLVSRLEQAQRQLQRESEQSQRLQKSIKEGSEREAHVREQLTSAVQLKTLAESKVDKLTHSRQGTLVELEQMTSKHECEVRKASRLTEDLADRHARFEELKALQEELLSKLESYAMEAETATRDKTNLRAQFEADLVRKRGKVNELESVVAAKEDEARVLSAGLKTLKESLSATQAKLETMTSEKLRLEQQLRDEHLEMETVLHDQTLELNEKAQEIAASEQRWKGTQESMKALDAAMRVSLERMTTTEPASHHSNGENDNDILDGYEATAGLGELKLCMHALDDLMPFESSCDSHLDDHLPSFRELLERIYHVVMTSTNGLEELLDSWARERVDLRKANYELQETTHSCELAMRKVHHEHLSTRERLEEVSAALTDEKRETLVLKHLNDELVSDIEALRVFKHQVTEQKQLLTTFKREIDELSANLQAAESALAEKLQHIKELYDDVQELTERAEHFEQIESALERAVELTEQQNARNEELVLKVHDLENWRCDHEESLEAFRAREKAFSERFRSLFRQYCKQLGASSSSLVVAAAGAQRKQLVMAAKDAEVLERLQMYEDEELRGDIVRLVQLFPMLLEDFVLLSSSTCITSHEFKFDEAVKPQKSRFEPPSHFYSNPNMKRMADTKQYVRFKMETHAKSSRVRPQRPFEPRMSPQRSHLSALEPGNAACDGEHVSLGTQRSITVHAAAPLNGRHDHDGDLRQAAPMPHLQGADDTCFREQLELIHDAFESFKQSPAPAHEAA